MQLRGRRELSEEMFGGNQNKDAEKIRGEENWWRKMDLVREGSRN